MKVKYPITGDRYEGKVFTHTGIAMTVNYPLRGDRYEGKVSAHRGYI